MSMNLNVKFNNESFSLWQTPTGITRMCLCNDKEVRWDVTGKAATQALNIYIEWVKSTLNGSYSSVEQLKAANDSANAHIAYLREKMNETSPRKTNVYMM